MIARLSEMGDLAIAIATGGWRISAELKLRGAEIDIQRIPLATADDSPRRDAIMSVAYMLASQAHQTAEFETFTYVGDGVWDLQASQLLGIPFIGVGIGARADKLRSRGVKHLVPNFADFSTFLELLRSLQK